VDTGKSENIISEVEVSKMGKKIVKTRYTREFKIETVKMFDGSGMTVKELSEKTGIPLYLCYRWIDDYRDNPEAAFPGTGKRKRGTPEQEEIYRLRKQLEEVTEELDILKKLHAIFSRELQQQNGSETSGITQKKA